jgi:hypothetical protein
MVLFGQIARDVKPVWVVVDAKLPLGLLDRFAARHAGERAKQAHRPCSKLFWLKPLKEGAHFSRPACSLSPRMEQLRGSCFLTLQATVETLI